MRGSEASVSMLVVRFEEIFGGTLAASAERPSSGRFVCDGDSGR